jgi:hypothetical protein
VLSTVILVLTGYAEPTLVLGLACVLIVLGALVFLVGLIWAVATWMGLEPPWWPRARHSLAELGWRASGAWSDFTDWVRLGR